MSAAIKKRPSVPGDRLSQLLATRPRTEAEQELRDLLADELEAIEGHDDPDDIEGDIAGFAQYMSSAADAMATLLRKLAEKREAKS